MCTENPIRIDCGRESPERQRTMIALLMFCPGRLVSPFKSKSRLEPENAVVVVLRRMVHRRVRLTNSDRLFFIRLYRWFPSVLKVITVIRPETIVRWYRGGFRRYWRWKSRPFGGRPQIERGAAGADPANEHREPALGSTAHPRRTAQARVRGRAVQRRQVHGQAAWTAKSGDGATSCAITCRRLPRWICS